MKEQSFNYMKTIVIHLCMVAVVLVLVLSVSGSTSTSVSVSVSASTISQSQSQSQSKSHLSASVSSVSSVLSECKQRNSRKQKQKRIPNYNNNNDNHHNVEDVSTSSIPTSIRSTSIPSAALSSRRDSIAINDDTLLQQDQQQQQQQPRRTLSSVFSFIKTPVAVEPVAAKIATTFVVVPLQQQQQQQQPSQYYHQQVVTTKSVPSSSSSSSSFVSKISTSTSVLLLHTRLQLLYTVWFTKVPTIIRYFISGNIGNIGLYVCEQIVFHCLGGNKISIINANDNEHINNLPLIVLPENILHTHIDTISFFIGYIVSIPFCHICYSVLVYGINTINTFEKYTTTLIGMYSTMIISCIGSTIFNTILQKYTSLSKSISFTITLYTFAIINYFIISWICTM